MDSMGNFKAVQKIYFVLLSDKVFGILGASASGMKKKSKLQERKKNFN